LYAVDLLGERVTGGRFAFASLIWGVILTGGHPETAAYAGLLAVLYTGWIAFVERRPDAWRFIRASGGSVVAGALLAAPFLIPFALLISIGVIYNWPGIIQMFNLIFRLAPPARMRCLFALLTSICAAAAVDLMERGIRRPVLIGIFGASLLLLTMTTFPFPTP